MDAAQIKRALSEAGLRPNAALGQNFCVDEARLAAIVDAADVAGRPVLEVGPGLGALTEPLLARAARVVAVEKDAAGPQLFTASAAAPDLTLTAREAGTLLEAYAPVSETDTQRLYQLTAPEYAALLTALDDAGIAWSGTAPDTAETFLVAVTP